jgi:hypothetical protein
MSNEADTCRKLVVPKLQAAGWDNEPYSIAEQRTITDGRIVPRGQGFLRKPPKRVDDGCSCRLRREVDGEIDVGGQAIEAVQHEGEAAHEHVSHSCSGEDREQADEIGRHGLLSLREG